MSVHQQMLLSLKIPLSEENVGWNTFIWQSPNLCMVQASHNSFIYCYFSMIHKKYLYSKKLFQNVNNKFNQSDCFSFKSCCVVMDEKYTNIRTAPQPLRGF